MSRGVILGVAFSVVLGAGGGVARLLSTGELAAVAGEPVVLEPRERAPASPGPEPEAPLAARQREMAEAVAARPALDGAAELTRYLATLRDKAQRNGRVSALDIAPGIAAIDQLVARKRVSPAARAHFLAEMQQLSAQLEGRTEPRQASVEELASDIAASDDAEERARLTQAYVARVSLEPPERQAALLARLRTLHPAAD